MTDLKHLDLKLGKETDEGTLDAVPRSLSRENLKGESSFFGHDLWNAYEVSFLLPNGKPVVYHMQARYDARTPNIVESKSFKLYLNSFNNRVMQNKDEFAAEVRQALSACVGGDVSLQFFGVGDSPVGGLLEGECIDDLNFQPGLPLKRWLNPSGSFTWHSHLLRSRCPVTGQPDWGALWVHGRGPTGIDPESLLSYVVGMREHQDFHEACCERIYAELHALLNPDFLDVACYYTRRGGLDINPRRMSMPGGAIHTAPIWRQ